MDIVQLIEEMEDIVDEASSVPFSSKVMVDKEEVLGLLREMGENLPDEIRQAQWTNTEKDRIIEEANRDAQNIITQANKEAERIGQEAQARFEGLVSEHDVTVEAQNRAEEITAQAENNARMLKTQSIQYIDEILATTEEKIKSILDELEANRDELRQ